ncbi:MAG: PAS domain-containing protein, partial [Nitrospinaceae bacterium]|nr:PAS domain-containing protein [Nitrospinaceae bacterium]NIR53377.1 PAS domain-containing protein [Nitrospinaceae bacterium]NIS83781.1 PAS domain-containing protein [Nitrospinaceae bacterium]NIT80580.1 PAS domain-containing protein [Nitrospinaceae bacterium]NIU42901.1 PAS domain-containing protein [Nitrospinaceae bacterium]
MSTQNNPEDLDIRNKPDSGESSRNLINAISTIQSYHVGQMDIRVLFENLLANFLALTESEYGFIGHVLVNEKDQKYLKSLAITNIAWNEETQKLYDENVETGLEFYNLDTLFGRVITTGEPVISNDPSSDPRGSGIPQGHPPLNAFLGLPLYSGDRLIGMVGLANRPQGYNEAVVSNLTPFLTTCSHIILAHLNDQKRQEIEKALRINEERLKLALEGASDGLWDWNVATGEVYFSPRWMTMLGYEPFELEGNVKTWEKLVHPEDMAHVMEVLTQHLEGKTPFYQTEHRVKGKHGHWVWILDRGKVVERDADGKPLRAVGTHADITQLKNIQVQLKGAIEEAERANQAKSEFLSRMSHELRTPLNAILGFGQLLDKDPALSQNQKDNVDKILQGGNHLLTLINEILDLSRIEAGNLKVSLENTSIRQAVNEVIDLLKPLADEMSISLHCQTDFSGLQAWVDRFRFKQILVNLVSNAIKYNKVHGEVSITWTPVSNGKFLLNVMDTGPGIPQDQLDKIFDPFYRSFEHQRRKEGSGIGLSISKQLI